MVDEEFHAFTDAFPLLRIFLAPLVCTLVLLESINHLADDVQPFRIAFVFSMLFNDVARCTAVWPFFCLQESPKMVGDNPCQTCVQRPYVFIRYFRISLVAFGFPRFFLSMPVSCSYLLFFAKVFALNAKSWQNRKIICLCFNSAHLMISFASKNLLWKILICQTF